MSFSDREPCDFIVDFETQQDSTVLGLRVGAIDAAISIQRTKRVRALTLRSTRSISALFDIAQ